MWLQLFLMALAYLVMTTYQRRGDTSVSRHRYVTFLIWVLVLQSALRHLDVGVDTASYCRDFEYTRDFRTWDVIWQNFYDVYVQGEGKDAGYWLLMKAFSTVCPSFRIYLFCVAICFFVPFYRLVEKKLTSLKQLYMSFCVYQVMFYSFFSITGIRQTIATIATFYCVKFIEERKLWKFVAVLVLAGFIHKSVFLFLPFYFILKYANSRVVLLGSLCSLPFVFGVARQLATFMVDISGAETYRMYAESEMDTGGAANFLVFMVAAAVMTLIAKYKNPDKVSDLLTCAMALAVFFTPMMWVDTSLMRVIQYYSIFTVIAIPLSIDCISSNPETRRQLYIVLIVVFLLTTIRHNYDYAFFWEEMQLEQQYL